MWKLKYEKGLKTGKLHGIINMLITVERQRFIGEKEAENMYQSFTGGLGGIALAKHGRSRAINAENPHGEKGKGGMAASELGPSRKGSPCLRDIEPGAVITLAEMEGPGEINHIWITVDNKTTDADCFLLRDLVIRMYWDDEETPSV